MPFLYEKFGTLSWKNRKCKSGYIWNSQLACATCVSYDSFFLNQATYFPDFCTLSVCVVIAKFSKFNTLLTL